MARPPLRLPGKGRAVRSVRPSAALRAEYQARLEREIADMGRSLAYWLRATYRAETPEVAQLAQLAQDASPARVLRAAMRRMSRRWERKFEALGDKLGTWFATAASERVDTDLKAILRDAGFTVRFKATAAQNDAFQAVIGDNVALIRDVADKHLAAVEGAVMRSVQAGRDLAALTDDLESIVGVTRRRAARIARHQNNLATATMTRVRQQELGLKKARWRHSAGGKTPRPDHVKFSGQLYEVAKGAYLEGKWTWPGVEPGCRCVSEMYIPGFDD